MEYHFEWKRDFPPACTRRNIHSEDFLHGIHSAGAVSPGDERLFYPYPYDLLAFSGGDLFSQIWILPGVTSSLAGQNFMVDGGGYDENLLLLDGVPVFHPGHFSSLLPVFNGDAVKNMVFHKGFFPTPLEGRISSVTEVNLKEGNKKEHVRTLTLDMPAASVMLEGPIIKNKLSYMAGHAEAGLIFSIVFCRKKIV